MRKVIVDTDAGIDDALALMLVAADPDVELLAVLSVFGAASASRTADNARYVLDMCGRTDVPVYRGCAAPLMQPLRLSAGIHGADGFGDSGLTPDSSVPREPTASAMLLDLVNQHEGEIDYLAIGPQTNLATAMQTEPRLLERLRSATILGTLGPALLHDTEPWADRRFRVSRDGNVSRDFEAARRVADSIGAVTWCGPYVTRQALVPEEFFHEIAATGSAPAQLVARISTGYADFYTRSYPQADGRRVMGINDSIAAATLLRPDLVIASVHRPLATFEDAERGERYLAGIHPTATETRPSHRIIVDVDFDGVVELIGETLRRPLPWR